MAQQAIKAKNKQLVDAVLKIRAERGQSSQSPQPIEDRPLIAVTCSTGWECYAVVEELTKTHKFRVRALYRTPGTRRPSDSSGCWPKPRPIIRAC